MSGDIRVAVSKLRAAVETPHPTPGGQQRAVAVAIRAVLAADLPRGAQVRTPAQRMAELAEHAPTAPPAGPELVRQYGVQACGSQEQLLAWLHAHRDQQPVAVFIAPSNGLCVLWCRQVPADA